MVLLFFSSSVKYFTEIWERIKQWIIQINSPFCAAVAHFQISVFSFQKWKSENSNLKRLLIVQIKIMSIVIPTCAVKIKAWTSFSSRFCVENIVIFLCLIFEVTWLDKRLFSKFTSAVKKRQLIKFKLLLSKSWSNFLVVEFRFHHVVVISCGGRGGACWFP